jgi:hypothetical protein
MQRFVGSEIAKLIELAYRDAPGMEENTARLVGGPAFGPHRRPLEPLRLTLRLEKENYKEGIFAWKGFLYYKWVLNSLWGNLRDVFAELGRVRVIGPSTPRPPPSSRPPRAACARRWSGRSRW